MKLEQPKGLNRLRVKSLSWTERWRAFLSLMPFMLLMSMFMVESVVLKWISEDLREPMALRVAGVAVAPFVAMFLLIIIAPKLDAFMTPTLEFRDKLLVIQSHHGGFIPWNRVIAFQLSPLPGHSHLTLLNVVSKPSATRKLQRKWSMILDRATQVPLLVAELHRRRQSHPLIRTQSFAEPLPERRARRLIGFGPYLLGIYLLLHGVILLIVLFQRPPDVEPNRKHAALKAERAHWVQDHFSSLAEFRRCLFVSGSILSATGVVSLGWGIMAMRRETKAAEAQTESDFAREIALARDEI